ncbi:sugar transferase [Hahella ganghwensis]|uniref:sugar transferase n=1 Tax=Hahella ganghwensis TaxID=286420 RepID=UPI0003820801|nr:sugar transferase [Hahella ganghwensis]
MKWIPRDLVKRATDVVLAMVAIVIFVPLWLVIAVLILLEDGSPVLFRQKRLGKNKAPIAVIKLRTMKKGKVTQVGTWLRSTGLDESPQFLSVLAGKMSIIGPRPLTEADICRIGWSGEECADRWHTAPGITGMAQLFSGRGARLSLYLDRYYLQQQSLGLDIKIIFLSFLVTLIGKKRVQAMMRMNRKPSQSGFSALTGSILSRLKGPQLSRKSPGVIPSQDLNQR